MAANVTMSEKIGTLTADVTNLNKNFDNLNEKVEKLVEISQQMCEFLVITKNNHQKLIEMDKKIENIRNEIKKNVLDTAEQFGFCYDDRIEMHKDLLFLRSLRATADETKKHFIKEILKKIIEWGMVAYVAGAIVPQMTGG